MKLDATDRKIVYELEQDCRRNLSRIAKKVRVSKQTLHYRIQRLLREGVITQFITVLNVSKLGLVNHEVWIQLELLPEAKKKEFVDFLVKHESTRWVALCGGKMDLAAAITAENIVQFSSIWQAILDKYPGHVKNYFLTISSEYYTYPRSHLAGETERVRFSYLGGEPKKFQLDETEIRILRILSKDARIPTTDMAERVGVSENTVRAKIKKLEKEEIIQSYVALIQPAGLGIIHFELLCASQNITREMEKKLEKYCLSNPYITYYLKLAGKYDIDIAYDALDSEHFQKLLVEFRSQFFEIIKEFEFVYILRQLKFDYFAGFRQ